MPFMLRIRWDIKEGREADFRQDHVSMLVV